MRFRLLAGLVSASLVVLAGCSVSAAPDPAANEGVRGASGASAEPITVGFAVSKTGSGNFVDGPVLAAAELAVQDVNKAGGVAGRQLKIVTADNKSDPSQVVPAALAVLDQKADVVVTTCDYDLGAPAAREANKAGKLALGCGAAPTYGLQGIGPLSFSTSTGTPTEGAAMAEWIQKKGWSKPYVLQDTSNQYGKTGCDYFKKSWAELGGALGGADTFVNSDPSISSQVTRVKGSGADVIILCSYAPGGPSAVKQIRDSGIDTPFMAMNAMDGSYWLESVPNLDNFFHLAIGSIYGDDPRPEVNTFFKRYDQEAADPAVTGTFALFGYSTIQTIAEAIKTTGGDTSGAALQAALEGFSDQPLLAGPSSYSATCHMPLGRPMVVMQVQGGKPAAIEMIAPTGTDKSLC